MSKKYILSVDQSTQGTKAMLFDEQGRLTARADLPHRQIIDEHGWVEHDPEEILRNTLQVCRNVIEQAAIEKSQVAAMGISNQRETIAVWDRETGKPLHNAIVWQCARASELCQNLSDHAETVTHKTGLTLSPYFSASKLSWMIRNVPAVAQAQDRDALCCGTMDSWLVFHLTQERAHKTDYSNASRTQLMNIRELCWDRELCALFGVKESALPEICMSDALYGHTNLGGFLDKSIPVCGVLGDSHGALLGQNCRNPGEVKATYGTGSSVMMQTGETLYENSNGLVTSLAWGLVGKVEYVLEGNLNYTGAVVSWMRDQACLIQKDSETEVLANTANPDDKCYFVPAFTGLGAPYWDSDATGMFTGITRTTGRAELVKAGLESIGYQITDLLHLMSECTGMQVAQLRVDGGPTVNQYLMQFQSDIAGASLRVPNLQELSGFGAAIAAGLHIGLYQADALDATISHTYYQPAKDETWRVARYAGWKQAIRQVLNR